MKTTTVIFETSTVQDTPEFRNGLFTLTVSDNGCLSITDEEISEGRSLYISAETFERLAEAYSVWKARRDSEDRVEDDEHDVPEYVEWDDYDPDC